MNETSRPLDADDYYWDDGKMVLTARYHLRRGSCCGNGCRHCPYPAAPDGFGKQPAIVTLETPDAER